MLYTDHIESNDIAKRNLAGLVPLHENAIDNFWTATGRKAENKWLLGRRVKRFDSAWCEGQLSASLIHWIVI